MASTLNLRLLHLTQIDEEDELELVFGFFENLFMSRRIWFLLLSSGMAVRLENGAWRPCLGWRIRIRSDECLAGEGNVVPAQFLTHSLTIFFQVSVPAGHQRVVNALLFGILCDRPRASTFFRQSMLFSWNIFFGRNLTSFKHWTIQDCVLTTLDPFYRPARNGGIESFATWIVKSN